MFPALLCPTGSFDGWEGFEKNCQIESVKIHQGKSDYSLRALTLNGGAHLLTHAAYNPTKGAKCRNASKPTLDTSYCGLVSQHHNPLLWLHNVNTMRCLLCAIFLGWKESHREGFMFPASPPALVYVTASLLIALDRQIGL